jgi:ParB-like chromosome segregation protein Spo0J
VRPSWLEASWSWASQISDLRPHPRQAAFFSDLTDADLAILVDDIRRNGLRNRIVILADGTIVCGHQRVRAAKLLGWSEIEAVILDSTDDAENERLMIEDNLSRRHLGPVSLARIFKSLRQLDNGPVGESAVGDLRDRIAMKIAANRSGRTLERWLRILDAPPGGPGCGRGEVYPDVSRRASSSSQ